MDLALLLYLHSARMQISLMLYYYCYVYLPNLSQQPYDTPKKLAMLPA